VEPPAWIDDVGSTVIPDRDWTSNEPETLFDPSRQALMVFGGVPHCVYHWRGDCGVLYADSELARRCGQQFGVRGAALPLAQQRGIACPMCLPREATERNDWARMKRCVYTVDSEIHEDTLLLTWRRDPNRDWHGVVVYEEDGEMARSIAKRPELQQITR
jgi:hypothetical protein